ncbi:hypothetical protein [Desulfobacter latus]|uniref:EVE domain-containing protein n=1 Tax=Desulfobacter latus TaxID=2292 RepID=A0A850T6Z0_9BACT|nr:hypothetical protein [Desulfobacter latus]NWH06861.1 hypothetical protein [Desulfobacter latus]
MAWNPSRWSWNSLNDQIQQIQTKGSVEEPWTCGNRKDLPIGSRVFLFKQGTKQRGIIGVGVTLSEPKKNPHYNSDLAAEGKAVNQVNVRWNLLAKEPIIPYDVPMCLFVITTRHLGIWF